MGFNRFNHAPGDQGFEAFIEMPTDVDNAPVAYTKNADVAHTPGKTRVAFIQNFDGDGASIQFKCGKQNPTICLPLHRLDELCLTWLEVRSIQAKAKISDALSRAERFISGFEGDENQEGIAELLADIQGASRYLATLDRRSQL